jgi:hypothetical protein
MFVLQTPTAVELPIGESEVIFTVDQLPPLEGTFSLAVGVEDGRGGSVAAAARYEHRLHIRSGHGHGLLAVPHIAAVRPAGGAAVISPKAPT